MTEKKLFTRKHRQENKFSDVLTVRIVCGFMPISTDWLLYGERNLVKSLKQINKSEHSLPDIPTKNIGTV